MLARAQEAPPGAIGRVDGNDVSVEGGAAAGKGTATVASDNFVGSGSVVTVHSGQARMTLVDGGQIDICGPAKFTLLQASNAITLALNFGRMHIQLPAVTLLRIFTPTIIATPLGIGGEASDIAVGLDLSDSLCVVAMNGAVRLEHQFTDESLIVPQAGEFSLAGGRLLPVAGLPGSCQCGAEQSGIPPTPPPIPEEGLTTPAAVAKATAESRSPASTAEPPVEFSIPAHANEGHPIAPPEENTAPAPPVDSMPLYKIVMPPLTFSASAAVPPEPAPDMILLVREVQVEPAWEFTGHVEAPRSEDVAQRALAPHGQIQPPPESGKKKSRFWRALKWFFSGSSE
jgi:hypothetical protein